MNYKAICIVFTLTVCIMRTDALPRDSSVTKSEAVLINSKEDAGKIRLAPKETGSQFGIPGRVTCPYEEATEDSSCQEHCLPKGYSYGICVSGTCSCI